MNRLLNLIVALFGTTLIITGLLKCFTDFDRLTLFLGNSYAYLPLKTGIIPVILINFLGGFAFLFHALSTFNYKKSALEQDMNDSIDQPATLSLKEMSRPAMLSGSYSILLGLWFLIKVATLISDASKLEVSYIIELLILLIGGVAAFGILPIILVSKNISLSNQIRKRNESAKMALIREKLKDKGIRRR